MLLDDEFWSRYRRVSVGFAKSERIESSGTYKIVATKKLLIFFFSFLLLSGELGKQSLRFRAAITFFFGITLFLYQDQNPVDHMSHWRQFCASLKWRSISNNRGKERPTAVIVDHRDVNTW